MTHPQRGERPDGQEPELLVERERLADGREIIFFSYVAPTVPEE